MRQFYLITLLAIVFAGCSKKDNPNPTVQPQPLAITDFNPKSASVGSNVMIAGTDFGLDSNAVSIKFGSSTGVKPHVITGTQMSVIVPNDAQTGKIQVTIGNVSVTSADSFTLTKAAPPLPTIAGFSPESAHAGETVTINGTNFGTDTNFVSVRFGISSGVKPKTITATTMTVIVPADAATGKVQISVNGSSVISSTDNFTLLVYPFTITNFSPKTVTTGDTIKITGNKFGTDVNSVLVYLNRSNSDLGTKPILVTPTEIDVIVPYTAISGPIKVWLQGLGFVTSNDSFTFLPQTLTAEVSPASARAGEIVFINGDFNLTDNLNSFAVRFNGSATDVHPLAIQLHNNMLVRVPYDAKTGKISVTKTGFGPGLTENVFTVLPQNPPLSAGNWVPRNSIGTIDGKAASFAFVINNYAYVGAGTGNVPFNGPEPSVWQYDTKYEAWMQVADYGGGPSVAGVGFAIGNKGYAGTGYKNNDYANDFWEYDPDANKWTQKADFKGAKRLNATAFAAGGKGYIGCGNILGGGSVNDFYSYDPASDTWTQIQSIPGVRSEASSFVIDNVGYVGNGCNQNLLTSANKVPYSDLYMYDATLNAWTAKASIPNYNFFGAGSFAIDGKGYLGAGQTVTGNTSINTNKAFEYTPSTNTWRQIADYGGTLRSQPAGFAIGNVGYIGGGYTADHGDAAYKDFWAFSN